AWFHCASLGEFEQGRSVLEAFRREFPHYKILLTFFSPSGYEQRRNYAGADVVSYLPADTPANARRFVGLVKPSLVVWVKYEFWFHHLCELHERNVPVALISAIFRPDQLFFKYYGSFYRKILGFFDRLFVQNEESLRLLRSIGVSHATLGGDTRFDRVVEIAAAPTRFPLVERFKGNAQLLVVGSLWPDDWAVIRRWYSQFRIHNSPFKILLAPHETIPAQIDRWMAGAGVPALRYSQVTSPDGESEAVETAEILWVDTIGMLSSLYQYADYAFIGGAYGDGLHNVLEAAVYGVPLFFGDKHYQKFQEAHDLLALGAAFAVADADALASALSPLRADETERRRVAGLAVTYVRDHVGATERVLGWLREKA
ncbi:MAG: 3-deoxy-D-manno-octulosonic acid transferase, partial [Sphingobacteriaceae bacterium]|nr:3-deoxy-D-manno-octulosonic acid transferase [Cytophagaceae bacterium]